MKSLLHWMHRQNRHTGVGMMIGGLFMSLGSWPLYAAHAVATQVAVVLT